jgi:hypothetical protein
MSINKELNIKIFKKQTGTKANKDPDATRRCILALPSALNGPMRAVPRSDTSVALWDLRPVRVPRRLGICCVWVLNLIRAIYGGQCT